MVNIPVGIFIDNLHTALNALPYGNTLNTVMEGLETLSDHFLEEQKKIVAARSREIEGAIEYCDRIITMLDEVDTKEPMLVPLVTTVLLLRGNLTQAPAKIDMIEEEDETATDSSDDGITSNL